MEEPKDEDGFYGCVATVTFGDSDEKSSSWTEKKKTKLVTSKGSQIINNNLGHALK